MTAEPNGHETWVQARLSALKSTLFDSRCLLKHESVAGQLLLWHALKSTLSRLTFLLKHVKAQHPPSRASLCHRAEPEKARRASAHCSPAPQSDSRRRRGENRHRVASRS